MKKSTISSKGIFDNLEKFSHNLALNDDKKNKYSYKEILEFEKKFKYLKKTKSLIIIICQNNFDTISAYVSFLRLNQTVFLISNHFDELYMLDIINRYKPKYLFFPKKFCSKKIKKNNEIKKKFEKSFFYKIKKEVNYQINKELSLLLMTSGSTGSPQTVRLSNLNLKSNAQSIANYFKIKKKDKVVTTLPMNYALGLSIINSHLIRGASITLTNFSIVQKQFWELINNNKINTFTGVPFTFETLKKIISVKNSFPSLKYITQAGGKLNKDLVEYFDKFFKKKKIRFYIMYGQTEACARMSFLNYKKIKLNPESIGEVIPGGKFSIIDSNGLKINKSNVSGELVYSGNNVSLGYAKSYKDLIRKDENNKILKTGDIAYRNKKNLFFITGRKKRFIKINGIRISLDSIENEFKKENLDCICTGEDNKLEIYCIKSKYSDKIFKKIVIKLQIRKSNYKLNFINRIPRNQSGKIMYQNLKI